MSILWEQSHSPIEAKRHGRIIAEPDIGASVPMQRLRSTFLRLYFAGAFGGNQECGARLFREVRRGGIPAGAIEEYPAAAEVVAAHAAEQPRIMFFSARACAALQKSTNRKAAIAWDRTVAVATRTNSPSFAAIRLGQAWTEAPSAGRGATGTELQLTEENAAGASGKARCFASKGTTWRRTPDALPAWHSHKPTNDRVQEASSIPRTEEPPSREPLLKGARISGNSQLGNVWKLAKLPASVLPSPHEAEEKMRWQAVASPIPCCVRAHPRNQTPSGARRFVFLNIQVRANSSPKPELPATGLPDVAGSFHKPKLDCQALGLGRAWSPRPNTDVRRSRPLLREPPAQLTQLLPHAARIQSRAPIEPQSCRCPVRRRNLSTG